MKTRKVKGISSATIIDPSVRSEVVRLLTEYQKDFIMMPAPSATEPDDPNGPLAVMAGRVDSIARALGIESHEWCDTALAACHEEARRARWS
jgi:hypothetical protein